MEPNPEPSRAPPNTRHGLRNRRSQVRILSGALGGMAHRCFGRKAAVLLCMESSTLPRDTAWAMSQENVDRFLEGTEAFNRGDVERWLETFHPDAVFEPQLAALEGDYIGHDGMRRFFAELADLLEMFEADYPDARDLGDRVLALGTFRSIGKGAGSRASFPWRSWRPSEKDCAAISGTTANGLKPSKPPGCRSRTQVFGPGASVTVPLRCVKTPERDTA